MRTSLVTLPLLLATATLAQAPVTAVPNFASNCPVGMTAQREAFGRTEWIVSLEDSRDPAITAARRTANTGVYLELNAHKSKPLSQVKVAVDFAQYKSGVMPAETKVTPSPETQKTFDLSAGGGSASELSGSLLLGQPVFVTRVHLLGITYADGSKWQPAAGSSCSIKPSLYMPVDSR
jgi:hypothetical protein